MDGGALANDGNAKTQCIVSALFCPSEHSEESYSTKQVGDLH